MPADSLSQPLPSPPDTVQGPSPDHHQKPSLRLSLPTPAPNLTKTFAPTWTLTLNPAPDTQLGPTQPDTTQGPRPDHHHKPRLSLGPTQRPQTPAFSPCPSCKSKAGPRPQPPACRSPTLPQLVSEPNPNPSLSRPRPPVPDPKPNPRLSQSRPPDTDPNPQPSARCLSRSRPRHPALT
eukprot:g16298.t1